MDDPATISQNASTIIKNCAEEFIKQSRKTQQKYQDRIVAFVDILGFKNIISKTANDQKFLSRIIRIIAEIRDQFLGENKSGHKFGGHHT